MERGLYVAASGMLAQQAIQDDLASNIANANTVGYKQDNTTFRALQTVALSRVTTSSSKGPGIGELGQGVAPDQQYTDWQAGPIAQTGNPLDASLADNQFFAIRTPNGERYTRAGNLQLDATGMLVNSAGLPVLDANNQPINAKKTPNVTLDNAGNLTSNGKVVARLKIVQPGPNDLVRDGDSLFAAKTPSAIRLAARPQVRPGTLEQSNVNPVMGMVRLITVSRAFEMAQRALVTQDELLRHATNEVGKM